LKNKNGFSLIEALIAVAIVAFVVLSIMSGFSSMLYTNQKTRSKTVAIALAEDRIEEIFTLSANQIINGGLVGETVEDFSETQSGVVEEFKNYRGYFEFRRITNISQNPTNPEMLNIDVTVEYGKVEDHSGNIIYPFRVILSTQKGI